MFSHCFSPDSGFFQCAATEVCDEISRERKFYTIKLLVICNTSMSTNKQTNKGLMLVLYWYETLSLAVWLMGLGC